MISNICWFIFAILYNKYGKCSLNEIVLPFKREFNYTHKYTDVSLLSDITDNSAGIEICIGMTQCVILSLSMSEYITWIVSSTCDNHNIRNNSFDRTKSDSYMCIDPTLYYFSVVQYQKGFISQDAFAFNNNEIVIDSYQFLLCEQYNYIDNNNGVIGFGVNMRSIQVLLNTNFLKQLNMNNIINSYEFSFEYETNGFNNKQLNDISTFRKGKVKIGSLHSGKYINENIIKNGNNFYKWGGYIKRVSLYSESNYIITESNEYEIEFDFGYILAPWKMHPIIEKYFFNKMKQKGICTEIKFRTFYYGYICNITSEKYIIDSFPHIYLDFNFGNIILRPQHLFIKFNSSQIICLLIFPSEDYASIGEAYWKFGAPFFKIQHMIFNFHNKTISYYIHNNNSFIKKICIYINSIMCLCCCIIFLYLNKKIYT